MPRDSLSQWLIPPVDPLMSSAYRRDTSETVIDDVSFVFENKMYNVNILLFVYSVLV